MTLKINEVEALVGIPKKNIRFYEAEGLITPSRDAANGYRDYGEEDVAQLRRVKLMRKLGVPIGEILLMTGGTHTVADGMRRHLVTLEREQQNLREAQAICEELRDREIPIDDLDAEALLQEMEARERSGAAFRNVERQDVRRRYAAPIVAALVMVLLMVVVAGTLLWAIISERDTPPWMLVILLVPAAVIAGTVLALVQRLRELREGEADDAKRY